MFRRVPARRAGVGEEQKWTSATSLTTGTGWSNRKPAAIKETAPLAWTAQFWLLGLSALGVRVGGSASKGCSGRKAPLMVTRAVRWNVGRNMVTAGARELVHV